MASNLVKTTAVLGFLSAAYVAFKTVKGSEKLLSVQTVKTLYPLLVPCEAAVIAVPGLLAEVEAADPSDVALLVGDDLAQALGLAKESVEGYIADALKIGQASYSIVERIKAGKVVAAIPAVEAPVAPVAA